MLVTLVAGILRRFGRDARPTSRSHEALVDIGNSFASTLTGRGDSSIRSVGDRSQLLGSEELSVPSCGICQSARS
jgi:hypothetical protein